MAQRLAPEQRRTQILDAVLPAVLEHGVAVTSRQLAEAAGVAEGTLFRVFGDKDTLLRSVLEREMFEHLATPTDTETDSLAVFITHAADVLIERFTRLFALIMALGPIAAKPDERAIERFDDLHDRLASGFRRFADRLSTSPDAAAEMLIALSYAASSNWGRRTTHASRDDVIAVMLHGLVAEVPRPERQGTKPGSRSAPIPLN